MPPKVKITRDMIIDAAFDIIRNEGSENLNARNIAARLNCSTQPVLYSFKTVDEIREAVYRKADEYHTSFILPKKTDKEPMLAMGLNYVRFGHEERNLFRFLFQSDKFTGMDIKTLSEILGHKNANITLKRYAHSLYEHKADMMNKIGRILQDF